MPEDRDESTKVEGPATTPEMQAVDDEATRIDPSPKKAAVPQKKSPLPDDDDDEATKATGTPKKAREAQKILEESRRLNAAGGPKPVKKKLHPFIPLTVAFVLLAMLLLVINWFIKPSAPDAAAGQPEPGAVRKLFDW